MVCAGKPSRRAAAAAACASDWPRRVALATGLSCSVEAPVEEHEKAETGGCDGGAVARPGVGFFSRRMVEPVAGVRKFRAGL